MLSGTDMHDCGRALTRGWCRAGAGVVPFSRVIFILINQHVRCVENVGLSVTEARLKFCVSCETAAEPFCASSS